MIDMQTNTEIQQHIYEHEVSFNANALQDPRLSVAAKCIWLSVSQKDCAPEVLDYLQNLPKDHEFHKPMCELYRYGYLRME